MLDKLTNKDEIIKRMNSLNNKIKNTENLGEDYQIGAAYFMKIKTYGNNFEKL
jgi:cell fate (sporulation/competence/biofilm development) regulator YmcA (YheA/YmcA/DUF963 family)